MSDHISRREQRKDFRKTGTGRTTAVRIPPTTQNLSEKDSGSSGNALHIYKGRRTGLEVNSENLQKDGDGFFYAGEFFSKAKNQVLSKDTNFKFNLDSSSVAESRDITVNSSTLTTTTSASAMEFSENLSDYDSPSHEEEEEDIPMISSKSPSSSPSIKASTPTPQKSTKQTNNVNTAATSSSVDSNVTDRRVIPMEIVSISSGSETNAQTPNTKSTATPKKSTTENIESATPQKSTTDNNNNDDNFNEELELSPIIAAPNSKVLGFKSPSSVFQSSSPVNPNDSIFHFPEYSTLSDTPAKDVSISKVVQALNFSDTPEKNSKTKKGSAERVVVDDSEEEEEQKLKSKQKEIQEKPKGKRGRPPKNKPKEQSVQQADTKKPSSETSEVAPISSSSANQKSASEVIVLEDDDLDKELLEGHTKQRELSLSIIEEKKRERKRIEEEHNLPDEIGGFIDLEEDSNFMNEDTYQPVADASQPNIETAVEEVHNEELPQESETKEVSFAPKHEDLDETENIIEDFPVEPPKEKKKSKKGRKKKETKASEKTVPPIESKSSEPDVPTSKSKQTKDSASNSVEQTPKKSSLQPIEELNYSPELGTLPAPSSTTPKPSDEDVIFDDEEFAPDIGGFDDFNKSVGEADAEESNDQMQDIQQEEANQEEAPEHEEEEEIPTKDLDMTGVTDIIQKKTRGRKRKSLMAQNNVNSSNNASVTETPYIRKKVSDRTPVRYDVDLVPDSIPAQNEYLNIDKSFAVEQQGEESTNQDDSILPADLATEEPLPPASETPNKKKRRRTSSEQSETRHSERIRQKPLAFWKNHNMDKKSKTIKIPKSPAPKKRRVDVASLKEIGEFPVIIDGAEEMAEVAKNKNSLEEKFYKFEDASSTASSQPKLAESNSTEADFSVQVGFHNSDFKSGILKLYPNTTKPSANTKQHTEVFYVVSGAVEVTIYKTSFKINAGGFFYVPPQNSYTVTNPSDTNECKLCYFVQFN